MYDFDTRLDRSDTGASKWESRTPAEKAKGIIPMSVADMEFRTAPCIREAVIRAAEMGVYGYTNSDERFFRAVLNWMSRRHGLSETAESLVCMSGVVPSLFTAVRAYTDPGDRVIIQPPVYYPFRSAIERNGREILESPLIEENGRYAMDFDSLERAASDPRTKLMLLCSPHNPVGRVWTKGELRRLADICLKNDVIVVSDEIHSDIVLEGTHTPFTMLGEDVRQRALVCTSTSKTFNLPGLQLCTLVIPDPELRRRFVDQMRVDGSGGVSYFGRVATIAAYEDGAGWLDALLDYLRGNKAYFERFMAEFFPEAIVSPLEGTYLHWVNFRALGMQPEQLERFMRGKAELILDEGYIFGKEGEGYERFNIALPRAALEEALERLRKAAGR